MKKTIIILLVFVPCMMLEANAQNNVKILHPGTGFLNSINTRALRDFLCKHEKASGVVWYKVDKGFMVRFVRDSTAAGRSAYRSNGDWAYTIVQYLERAMPKQVRALVKSTYYDYQITLVEEIEQPNEPIKYLVHLQDAVSWKNVLVTQGEMELVEDKKKL